MFNSDENGILNVTYALLRQANIKINKNTLSQKLEQHPDYPGLLSIIDVVSSFNVTPIVYNIDKSSYDPEDFIFPFIAHLSNGSGHFILITKISNGIVEFSDNKFKNGKRVPETEFLSKWSGIAFRVEKTELSGEQGYLESKIGHFLRYLRVPALFLALSVWIYFSLSHNEFSAIYSLSIFFKIFGLFFSSLLLVQSINETNTLVRKLCALSGKNGCTSPLKSKASEITGWLSWSEVGFIYFGGATLSLLITSAVLPALSWMSLLAIPYVAYSINHQYQQGKWCALCLSVQLVLIFDAACTICYGTLRFGELYLPTLILLLGFVSVASLWGMLKQTLKAAAGVKKVKSAFSKFKYNTKLFQTALMGQPSYSFGHDLMPIELGNKNAKTKITMVSSPFCEPCSEVHAVLERLIHQRNDISLKIIFATSDNPDDEKNIVAKHLTFLSRTSDEETLASALHDWYSQPVKDFASWSVKYPMENKQVQAIDLSTHNQWCKRVGVEFTPTLFINGYKLPEPYQPSDLGYLLN